MAIDKEAIKQKKAELAKLEKLGDENMRQRMQLAREIEDLKRQGWPEEIPAGTVVLDSHDGREGILFSRYGDSTIRSARFLDDVDDSVFLLDASGICVPFHQGIFARNLRSRFQIVGACDPVEAVAAALLTAKKNPS